MSDEKVPITDVFGNLIGYVGGSGMGCLGLLLVAPLAFLVLLNDIGKVIGNGTVNLLVGLVFLAAYGAIAYRLVKDRAWGCLLIFLGFLLSPLILLLAGVAFIVVVSALRAS